MIPQSTNLWDLVVDRSKSLATTTRFAMDVGGITVGENVIDSINSIKKRTTTSQSPLQTFRYRPGGHTNQFWRTLPFFLFHPLSLMSWNQPHWRRLRYPYSKHLSLRSMWLGKAIAIRLPSRWFPYSGFRQANERDDSGTQQEVMTVAEDHWDPENPDHSTSPVLCRVMSSYGQVWNPWRVRGGIVTNFFLSSFHWTFCLIMLFFHLSDWYTRRV